MQTQVQMERARNAWETDAFEATLKEELAQLDAGSLPLQQGLSHSSYACDEDIRVVMISAAETAGTICVRAGIFYSGIIAGCSCADDPTPVDRCPEYCEVRVEIDTQTAGAVISLQAS